MKKLYLFFAMTFLLNSCSNDEPTVIDPFAPPYYSFSESDVTKLIPQEQYAPNDVLVFKNANNEILEFIVQEHRMGKQEESHGSFWGSYSFTDFYYDMQYFEMYSPLVGPPDNEYDYTAKIYVKQCRLPEYFNYNTKAFDGPKETSEFSTYIGLGPFKNNMGTTVNYNVNLYTMTINGITHTQVSKLPVPVSDEPNTGSPLPELTYVYYAQNVGIIGFDDVNGKEWRLQ